VLSKSRLERLATPCRIGRVQRPATLLNALVVSVLVAAIAIGTLIFVKPWDNAGAVAKPNRIAGELVALRTAEGKLRSRVAQLEIHQSEANAALRAWISCQFDNSLPVQRFLQRHVVDNNQPGDAYLDVASLYTVGSGQKPNIAKTAYGLVYQASPQCDDDLAIALRRAGSP
jgi:hypothetical protein